ncbi:unnamed protein product, partial [Mesorhabditis spiculigera]
MTTAARICIFLFLLFYPIGGERAKEQMCPNDICHLKRSFDEFMGQLNCFAFDGDETGYRFSKVEYAYRKTYVIEVDGRERIRNEQVRCYDPFYDLGTLTNASF